MKLKWHVEHDANDYSICEGNRRVAGYIVERKAARILAAAPDLLDALKALRKNVNTDLSGYWTESTSNFIQQADAAIKKAEGKG